MLKKKQVHSILSVYIGYNGALGLSRCCAVIDPGAQDVVAVPVLFETQKGNRARIVLENGKNRQTNRNLLGSDGATWRFRHRVFQEYFAERW